MAKIRVTYHDNDALTVEEIVKNNKNIHGKTCEIEVFPESMLPHDLISFALWQMTAATQTAYFFNEKELYPKHIKEMRADIMYKLEEILDDVILENEERLTKD